MMDKIKQLMKRHEKAKANLNEYRAVLEDAYTFAAPDRGYFNTLSGGKRSTKIYDSTAILGVGSYADKVQQNLVPPWRNWFMLVPGSEIPEDVHADIQPQLDEITDTIYDHLNHSNFNTKINEALQDVGISTGTITCEEGDGIESSLVFDSISVEDVAFEESANGILENVFRRFKLRIDQIEESIQGAKLTPGLTKRHTADENAKVELTECIIKNKDKKYDHVIFFEEDEEIVYDVVDDTSPFVAFRERVTSRGVYGLGRVIQLLNDIKVLNKICEMELKNAGLAISGVYTATDDGVLNPYNVRLVPGTVIPVGSNSNQNPSLRPLERSGDFNISQLQIQQKQELITKTLFGQALGSITEAPVRSATEVNARTGENFEMTTAAFSRFQTELLERLIRRIVDVLQKAGKIVPIVVDGKEITIKFTSPLAKQQDKLDVNVIVEFAQILGATGIAPQQLARDVKFEDVAAHVATNIGFPSELMRTEDERNEYDMKQAQQLAAQPPQEGQPQ